MANRNQIAAAEEPSTSETPGRTGGRTGGRDLDQNIETESGSELDFLRVKVTKLETEVSRKSYEAEKLREMLQAEERRRDLLKELKDSDSEFINTLKDLMTTPTDEGQIVRVVPEEKSTIVASVLNVVTQHLEEVRRLRNSTLQQQRLTLELAKKLLPFSRTNIELSLRHPSISIECSDKTIDTSPSAALIGNTEVDLREMEVMNTNL